MLGATMDDGQRAIAQAEKAMHRAGVKTVRISGERDPRIGNTGLTSADFLRCFCWFWSRVLCGTSRSGRVMTPSAVAAYQYVRLVDLSSRTVTMDLLLTILSTSPSRAHPHVPCRMLRRYNEHVCDPAHQPK